MSTAEGTVVCRYEASAQDIREDVQAMQRQVRVLADEKADLARSLHSEQQQSHQHQAQVTPLPVYMQKMPLAPVCKHE